MRIASLAFFSIVFVFAGVPFSFAEQSDGTMADIGKSVDLPMADPKPIKIEPELANSVAKPLGEEFYKNIGSLPNAPEFLKGVKNKADFEALSSDQQHSAMQFAWDATLSESATSEGKGSTSLQDGTVNCFDYYQFGSVQADIDSDTSAEPGKPYVINATLINRNDYPIVDGNIYIKVFRKPQDGLLPARDGYDVVDEVMLPDTYVLNGGERKRISFSWKVPGNLPKGDYQMTAYFGSAKKFNLLGLPFTDDVNGNTYDFSVENGSEDGAFFKKNAVSINGEPYAFAAPAPRVGKDEPVSVSVALSNPTKSVKDIPVSWTLYGWDQQDPSNIVAEYQETVSVNSGETKTLSHTVSASDIRDKYAVYLLVARALDGETSSVLNIRFVREGIPAVRINFPAVLSYPLEKGKSSTVFSCLHAAGTLRSVSDGKLVLTLSDMNGNMIHSYTYEGNITGNMMGVKDDFVPEKEYRDFTVNASLYRGGALVDETKMNYRCEDILGKSACVEKKNPWIFLGGLLAVLFIGIAVFVLRKSRRSSMSLFLAVFGFSLALFSMGNAPLAHAATVTVSKTYSGTLSYVSSSNALTSSWYAGLQNPTISVSYNAIVTKSGSTIPQGGSVSVGDTISFVPSYGTVSFNGTGQTSDTPYGEWKGGADFLTQSPGTVNYYQRTKDSASYWLGTCDRGYLGNFTSSGFSYPVYIQLSVNPQGSSLDLSGTTAGLQDLGGGSYKVTSAGTIKGTFNFYSTYSKFYYEYKVPSGLDRTGDCERSWGNAPMRLQDGTSSIAIPSTSIVYTITANPLDHTAPTLSHTCSASGQQATLSWTPHSSTNVDHYTLYWDDLINGWNGCIAPDYCVNKGTSTSHVGTTIPGRQYNTVIETKFVDGVIVRSNYDNFSCGSAAVNGSCGSSSGQTLSSAPTTNLCSSGTASSVSGSGPWNWSCIGSGGGSTASCSAQKLTISHPSATLSHTCSANGQQATLSWNALSNVDNYRLYWDDLINEWNPACNTPPAYTCVPPDYSVYKGTSTSHTGTTIPGRQYNTRIETKFTDGVITYSNFDNFSCGSVAVSGSCNTTYSGKTLSSIPSSGLCSAGTQSPTPPTDNGTYWSWSCVGSGGGSTVSCSANKTSSAVNGSCGSSSGQTLSSAPTTNLCSSGTASSVSGSGPWSWSCIGSGGGSTASCSANVAASCGGSPAVPGVRTVTGTTTGSVWGSGPYTSDSALGTAAVHAGILANGQSGQVTVSNAGCVASFTGSTRNGVTTNLWGIPWYAMTLSGSNPLPSGSINVASCTIPQHGNSCTSTVTWTSSNFSGMPSVSQGVTQFSTSASGSVNRTVDPNNQVFSLRDIGSAFSTSANASASCATNSSWNGSMCECIAPSVWNGSACAVCGVCGSPDSHCTDEKWADNCGNVNVCTGGTKDCRTHFKEVAP